MTTELQAIETLLRNEIGLETSAVGQQLIRRAVNQRMRDLQLDNLPTYLRHLRQLPAELQELIEEVIVPESWFFRDEHPYAWLRAHARQKLSSVPAPAILRLLSVPCAGGEEPYSIAISLLEEGLPASGFHIDAVDISTRRLAGAERGIYSQNAFRGRNPQSGLRHFQKCAYGYKIDPALRRTVTFIHGSILDPQLLKGAIPYDVVFCRNLLIYLVPRARATLLSLIDRLLAPDGVLLLGHADRIDSNTSGSGFTPTGDPGCFAYRRAAAEFGPNRSVVNSSPSSDLNSKPRFDEPTGTVLATDVSLTSHTANEYAHLEPTRSSNSHAVKPSIQLEHAVILANQGRFAEAINVCEGYLQANGPTASAYCLMGMTHQAAGNRERAEDCFRKAVYLDPTDDEALLALALIAERRGDQVAAAAFRRRAERVATSPRNRVN